MSPRWFGPKKQRRAPHRRVLKSDHCLQSALFLSALRPTRSLVNGRARARRRHDPRAQHLRCYYRLGRSGGQLRGGVAARQRVGRQVCLASRLGEPKTHAGRQRPVASTGPHPPAQASRLVQPFTSGLPPSARLCHKAVLGTRVSSARSRKGCWQTTTWPKHKASPTRRAAFYLPVKPGQIGAELMRSHSSS